MATSYKLDSAGAGPVLQWVQNGSHGFDDTVAGTATPSKDQLTQQIADFLDTHVRFKP